MKFRLILLFSLAVFSGLNVANAQTKKTKNKTHFKHQTAATNQNDTPKLNHDPYRYGLVDLIIDLIAAVFLGVESTMDQNIREREPALRQHGHEENTIYFDTP